MKHTLNERDHAESILSSIPIILTGTAFIFAYFGLNTNQDAITIALITAPIAVGKKHIATWFLNKNDSDRNVVLSKCTKLIWLYLLASSTLLTIMAVLK